MEEKLPSVTATNNNNHYHIKNNNSNGLKPTSRNHKSLLGKTDTA